MKKGKQGEEKIEEVCTPETGTGKFWVSGADGKEYIYEGSWIELNDENEEKTRVQNGIGSLFIDSIEIFQGSWIEGNPVHGCQTSIHGKYSGEIHQGAFHGVGKMEWLDGTVYEGDWDLGRFHGQGCLTVPEDNSTWEGLFKNGKYCGCDGKLLHQKANLKLLPVTMRFMTENEI